MDNQKMAEMEISMMNENQKMTDAIKNQKPKIGKEEVLKATEILQKYKKGKSRLEKKLIADEEFWKLRQWKYYASDNPEELEPATSWLWSCIQSRYSDAMDSYPTCNFRPRQEDDKKEAKMLTDIVPVILEQNRYEETYSDIVWYMLKHGGCVHGIFWNGQKNNGLGDIEIKKVDFINLFWEPGITNIQDSENVFHTALVSNRILEQRYPETQGKLGGQSISVAKYMYDDNVDTNDKSVVVDWYYKTEYNGRKCVHMVKYVNDIVLYATENDTEIPTREDLDPNTGIPVSVATGEAMADRGLYDHGLYPFVTQALYPIEGSLCGYGITDIGRDTQMQIDVINKAITDNTVLGAEPRFFIRNDGSVNEEEYTDRTKKLIHVEGNVSDDNIRPIESKNLDSIYVNVMQSKVDELKYITSNQDVNNGQSPNGITAASAIAALQETSGKNARSSNKAFHRAFREVCYQIVELIRQFYDVPRTFRIVPDSMGEQFVSYSNEGLVPQPQVFNGNNMGFRKPEFDIDVTSEKANPYKKMEQNELALNFYNIGFFNPENADMAVACLEMMDFETKDEMIQKLRQNQMLEKMMLQYQQMALMLAQKYDPMLAEEMANNIIMQNGGEPQMNPAPVNGDINLDGTEEHPLVEKARSQARASTQAE